MLFFEIGLSRITTSKDKFDEYVRIPVDIFNVNLKTAIAEPLLFLQLLFLICYYNRFSI